MILTKMLRKSNEENDLCRKWSWDNQLPTCKIRKLDLCLTPYIKVNAKWTKDLHVTARTVKFLEDNRGINLCDFGLGSGFLDMTPKAKAAKEVTDKVNSIKMKTFALQGTSSRKWKDILQNGGGGNFANSIFNKGLISGMYTEYYSTIIKRQALGVGKGADLIIRKKLVLLLLFT